MKKRLKIKKIQRKHLKIIGVIILLLILPISLLIVRQVQDIRSQAALPNNLEIEAGVLSSTGVSKQTDSNASGGQFVLFNSPTNPSPTTQPSVGGDTYGPKVHAYALNNSRIGTSSNFQHSYRFTSPTNAKLQNIRIYLVGPPEWIGGKEGYGLGTGGQIKYEIREDDGTSKHFPSNTTLASETWVANYNDYQNACSRGVACIFSWTNPPSLTEGKIYHIVFSNPDPNYANNYVSLDGIFHATDSQYNLHEAGKRFQDGYDNLELAQLIKFGNGPWHHRGDPNAGDNDGGVITPTVDMTFSNGVHFGMGYMEVHSGYPSQGKIISGSSNKIRQRFTVSDGNKNVTSLNIYTQRISGSGNLNIAIEQGGANSSGNGSQIYADSISSSNIPISSTSSPERASKATLNFNSPITLQNGQTYNIVLSTDSNTQYLFYAIRGGADYGYADSTFAKGWYAQETSNGGSTWTYPISWSNPENDDDWQIYFTTQ